jgi:hypothetical protein
VRRLLLAPFAVILVAACSTSSATTLPGAGETPKTQIGNSFSALTPSVSVVQTVIPDDISSWTLVAPVGQGFSFSMPGKATTSSMTIPGVNAPTTIWTYKDESGRAFQVARSRYAKGALSGEARTVLDKIAEGLPDSVAGSIMAQQTDVTIHGHAGRRYRLTSTKVTVEGMFIIVGDVLYTVYLAYEPSTTDPATLEAFLASFTLSA